LSYKQYADIALSPSSFPAGNHTSHIPIPKPPALPPHTARSKTSLHVRHVTWPYLDCSGRYEIWTGSRACNLHRRCRAGRD